jgi:UDP-glucose 4-epimerase
MTTLVFGGAGFVGLNLVEALLRAGRDVTVFDRGAVPEVAALAFKALPGRLRNIVADVRDGPAIGEAIMPGTDSVVFGTAITADAARDAREPVAILDTNLMAFVPILERAKAAGVRRVLNLSSAAVYGATPPGADGLAEDGGADPVSLYAISKFATERVGARLGALLGLDVVSVRLSAAFGPWERATGVRDTLSPLMQIFAAARQGTPALLPRPGVRDWIFGPDVAEALVRLLDAATLAHPLYNISTGTPYAALTWGAALAARRPGFVCRLAGAGETPTIDLHAPADRPKLAVARLDSEFGWKARHGLESSVAALDDWERRCGAVLDACPEKVERRFR